MEWCGKLYMGVNPEKYIRRFTEFFVMLLLLCLMMGNVVSSDNVVPLLRTTESEREQINLRKTDVLDTGTAEASEVIYRSIALNRHTAVADGICNVFSSMSAETVSDIKSVLSVSDPDCFADNTVNAAETEEMTAGDAVTENEKAENIAAFPALKIPEKIPDPADSLKDEVNNITVEIPEENPVDISDIPADSVPSPPSGSSAGAVIDGFLVDKTGAICGIAEPETAVEGSRLILPSEGCTAIASGAFLSAPEGIREVYIPANITHIEEGAFAGLYQLEWFKVESPGNYVSVDGVLFSDGGACLLAFPAARIGIYRVPSGVVRFASDAFDGASISKMDARDCLLEDVGNVPEEIEILQRL